MVIDVEMPTRNRFLFFPQKMLKIHTTNSLSYKSLKTATQLLTKNIMTYEDSGTLNLCCKNTAVEDLGSPFYVLINKMP